MKLELKSVKHYVGMSEETHCFQAYLWVNGKRAAHVRNDGHGGCTFYHFDDPKVRDAFEKHANALPPKECDFGSTDGKKTSIPMTPDFLLDCMFEDWLEAKEKAKIAKIDEQEKAKNKAKGFPLTVRCTYTTTVTWLGMKRMEDLPKLLESLKAKGKVPKSTDVLV